MAGAYYIISGGINLKKDEREEIFYQEKDDCPIAATKKFNRMLKMVKKLGLSNIKPSHFFLANKKTVYRVDKKHLKLNEHYYYLDSNMNLTVYYNCSLKMPVRVFSGPLSDFIRDQLYVSNLIMDVDKEYEQRIRAIEKGVSE